MPNDRAAGAPPPGEAGEAFFSHERAQEAKPLNNATRYLCAAPYLDSGFADRVIGELVATRRAVAPSVNVDIGPVIWHCRRARRMTLTRNLVLFGILLLALSIKHKTTVDWFYFAGVLTLLLHVIRWFNKRKAKLVPLIALLAQVAILSIAFAHIPQLRPGGLLANLHLTSGSGKGASATATATSSGKPPSAKASTPASSSETQPAKATSSGATAGSGGDTGSSSPASSSANPSSSPSSNARASTHASHSHSASTSTGSSVARTSFPELPLPPRLRTLSLVPLLFLAWLTEFVYRVRIRRTLTERLRPGADAPVRKSRPTDRISMVERAQGGNITLYAFEDPFIGAGIDAAPDHQWSIAVKLTPANLARLDSAADTGSGEWRAIDPVALHKAIAVKLERLNGSRLQHGQRISQLSLRDRLVGRGALPWANSLIDQQLRMPYSHASQEAIDEIKRHPQAHLRYYRHVQIDDEGPQVTSNDGREILKATDQGITISAFIYTAVEGGHFYLQFILTALRPVKPEYRAIDLLPPSPRGYIPRGVLGKSVIEFLPAAADSAGGIVWSAIHFWQELRSKKKAKDDEIPVADLGARISVRELGMADSFGSYIKLLDVEKYSSIIERAALKAVQGFLADHGFDTSAFNESAATVISGNIFSSITGGNVQLGGTGNTINQQHDNRKNQTRESGTI
jgi:hypothetical protein